MRVLVTDGDTRAALAITRSLGAQGHEILVSAADRSSIAGASRYCSSEYEQSPEEAGPEALRESLATIIARTQPDVVIGVTDRSLQVLHDLPAELAAGRLPPPDTCQYAAASDKASLFVRCREAGIDTPPGVVMDGGCVPTQAELAALGSPLVVRPALSWRAENGRWIHGSVSYETDRDSLSRRIEVDPA